MKICAIIAEFNPFHNGHAYLIQKAKQLSGCDAVLCIMSGSFTQRGDIAILDKFTRAKHAILNGADCVIELPAPFAVAPAEVFARGAVKLLGSIPEVESLAFGCETPTDFTAVAQLLESKKELIDARLKVYLKQGESYAKSYAAAAADAGCDETIFTPNNILATEYAKAILHCGRQLKLVPVRRVGGNYNDLSLQDNYSSASAIRANIDNISVINNVPESIYTDLQGTMSDIIRWETVIKYSLLENDCRNLKRIYGCNEGIENRLKDLFDLPVRQIIEEATGKRYPASRVRRILACNALKLYSDDTETFLSGAGYLKPLAVKSERRGDMLSALAKSPYPVVIKMRQVDTLDDISRNMFDRSSFADSVWNLVNEKNIYNFTMLNV